MTKTGSRRFIRLPTLTKIAAGVALLLAVLHELLGGLQGFERWDNERIGRAVHDSLEVHLVQFHR